MGLPETCSVGPGAPCSAPVFRYFLDCVCSRRDAASFGLGLASILCWAVAEIPQIVANWQSGNAEGVSLAFILTWTVGDVFNLVGCLMDPVTIPTQFFTAVLYTATTLILVFQHIWYNWSGRHDDPSSQQVQCLDSQLTQAGEEKEVVHRQHRPADALEGLFPSDPTLADGTKIPGVSSRRSERGRPPMPVPNAAPTRTNRQSPNSYGSWRRLTLATSYGTGTSPRLRAVLIGAVLTGGLGMRLPWLAGNYLPDGRSDGAVFVDGGRKLLQARKFSFLGSRGALRVAAEEGDMRLVVGQILGWSMTCIYLTGRLPQIILNVTRGSVEGLSFSMFAFAIGGNATYLASILVRSLQWGRIKPNLPWLVDSACCLAMDFSILGQFIYSNFRSKRTDSYSALSPTT
eukprot:SM000070S21336  [mRNA]  locus=s70:418145:421612:+ [translate_table: standard]